jgi:pseudouridine synthase
MHRVQKLLSNYGYCSRRKAEELIKAGRVKVNGRVISIGDKASEKDKIFVDGKPVMPEKKIYLMFHKPRGCLTAVSDERMKTVMDFIKIRERVVPVGRLDYNTSGLLLLTNDGDFANKVMHPRHEIKKTYMIGLKNRIGSGQIVQMQSGIELEEGTTAPAKIRKIRPDLIEITIHEGKKRIVRRMCEKIGLEIKFLHRTRIGKLELRDLKPGRYWFLKEKDLEKIFK